MLKHLLFWLAVSFSKSHILVATAQNFTEIVLDSEYDALVIFYAPWSGHCRMAREQLSLAAQILAPNPDVKIIEIDRINNEITDHQITAYPTIKYFKKGQHPPQVQNYENERSKNDKVYQSITYISHQWIPLEGDPNEIVLELDQQNEDIFRNLDQFDYVLFNYARIDVKSFYMQEIFLGLAKQYRDKQKNLIFTQKSHDYKELDNSSITYFKNIDGQKSSYDFTGEYKLEPLKEWIENLYSMRDDI